MTWWSPSTDKRGRSVTRREWGWVAVLVYRVVLEE
jgi:hypothetical protein